MGSIYMTSRKFYDFLKNQYAGHGWTDHMPGSQKNDHGIIEHQMMLHFWKNHDEPAYFASPNFEMRIKPNRGMVGVRYHQAHRPTMILLWNKEVG